MITVITPVYNGEKFIEKCIQVIINQNCPEVEHIIVDGGSKDRTVEIIQQYAEKYSHIRWISEKDKGQSDAMNNGIAMAKGKILSFLNVDDYYEPNALNRILKIFENLPEPSLLVGNCNVWGNNNIYLFLNKPKRLKFTELLLGPAFNAFPLNPSAYFYHISLHKKIGLYNLDEHYTLDLDFLLRAVQVANVKYIDETFGNYCQIENTKTWNDIKSGESSKRVDKLMKKFRKNLPLIQYLLITIRYEFYKNVDWPRFNYFIEDPKRLVPTLIKKINHIPYLKSFIFR
jgi:glycosyltransferase involved in cell wall biosynthesis